MSWGSSIATGALAAVVGAIVAGIVASLATIWYRVSGFEAGAAAFVSKADASDHLCEAIRSMEMLV